MCLFGSPHSVTDLLSVIPIWFLGRGRIPNVGTVDASPAEIFLMFMYGLSITRILRALRIIYVETSVRDPVTKCLLEYGAQFLIAMLFSKYTFPVRYNMSHWTGVDTAVINFVEQEQGLPYHTWIYFIWVTTATVGYGDIK
jgi:hypothetical protein